MIFTVTGSLEGIRNIRIGLNGIATAPILSHGMNLPPLRFALSQFFERIRQTIFYQVAVGAIILFVLVSIYILVMRIYKLDLEGWKDEEK